MSGNSERTVVTPQNNGDFPACPECGNAEWQVAVRVLHYYTMWRNDFGNTIISSEDEYEYTGDYEDGWWCNECGFRATPEMVIRLNLLMREADWN